MRRVWSFDVLCVAAVLLAGCGGSDSGSPASTAVSSPAPSSVVESSSSVPVAASSAPSGSAASSAPPTKAAGSSAAAAPAGAVIKGGGASHLPLTVGIWTTGKDASGPATIYENPDGGQIGVGFLPGSDYNAIVTNVKHEKTRAGTGYCGTTTIRTSLTCYIESVDGVYNISTDLSDAPLSGLVAFVNQLTALLGTR